jgi:hypothetical protein
MPPSSSRTFSFQGEHPGAKISNRPVLAERRATIRFPLDPRVRFRSISGRVLSGTGRATNLSSGGVLVASPPIASQHEISVGVHLKMSIEWPLLLDGRIPLQLFAVGRVVRRNASAFAVSFERYQFRTMKKVNRPPVCSASNVTEWPGQ